MTQTSRDLVEQRLERIAEVDGLVRSVCTLDPTALEQADALDREAAEGRLRGPLHGVPVLVKDNIDTAGLATTAGSLALAAAEPPARDAELVRRLRAAGLVVLGKTNLSEWANFRDEESTSGWSAYGGLTRNPYALNRSSGGSSSGSGAAVAAGLARFAVGTETDGSISCPAALNGVVGIKPTVGTVPTVGVVPISSSQDSPGSLGATVRDAAALLDVLAGSNGVYAAAAATPAPLEGRRVGVPRAPWWGYSRHADGTGEEALRLLSAAGAEIVDEVDLGGLATFGWDDELAVMMAEFRSEVADYLATRTGEVPRTLEELIAFNEAHAEVELAHFGQSVFKAALSVPGVDTEEYAAARARCLQVSRTDGIDKVLAEHDLDALVTPSYAPAWPIDLVNAEGGSGSCTQPAALAGYPLVTVPVQLAGGLPVSVSFWGGAGSETTLIGLAAALEARRDRMLGPLAPPTFTPFV